MLVGIEMPSQARERKAGAASTRVDVPGIVFRNCTAYRYDTIKLASDAEDGKRKLNDRQQAEQHHLQLRPRTPSILSGHLLL